MDNEDDKAKMKAEKRLANLAKAREKAAMLREQLKAARKQPTKEIPPQVKDDNTKPEPEPTSEEPTEEPTATSEPASAAAPAADRKSVPNPPAEAHEQNDNITQKSKRKAPTRTPREKSADRSEPRRDPKEASTEIVAPPPRAPLYRRENGLLFI